MRGILNWMCGCPNGYTNRMAPYLSQISRCLSYHAPICRPSSLLRKQICSESRPSSAGSGVYCPLWQTITPTPQTPNIIRIQMYSQNPANVFTINTNVNMLRKRISFSGVAPGSIGDVNAEGNVIPVGLITPETQDGKQLKIVIVPLDLAGMDGAALKNTLESINHLRKYAHQIDAFATSMIEDYHALRNESEGQTEQRKHEETVAEEQQQFPSMDNLGVWENYTTVPTVPSMDVNAMGTAANQSIPQQNQATASASCQLNPEHVSAIPAPATAPIAAVPSAAAAVPAIAPLTVPQAEPKIMPPSDTTPSPMNAQALPLEAEGNCQVEEVVLTVPEGLSDRLNEMAISSMQLSFEMDMTNVRDAIINGPDGVKELSEQKGLDEAVLTMETKVELDTEAEPECAVPLQFQAQIRGIVQIDASKLDLSQLTEEGLPEYNDTMTAIAANLCSTALKTSFPSQNGIADTLAEYTDQQLAEMSEDQLAELKAKYAESIAALEATPAEVFTRCEVGQPISAKARMALKRHQARKRMSMEQSRPKFNEPSLALPREETTAGPLVAPGVWDDDFQGPQLRDGCKNPIIKPKKKCPKKCPLDDPCKEDPCKRPQKKGDKKKVKKASKTTEITASAKKCGSKDAKGGADSKKSSSGKGGKGAGKDGGKDGKDGGKDPCAKFKKGGKDGKDGKDGGKDGKKDDPCAKFKKGGKDGKDGGKDGKKDDPCAKFKKGGKDGKDGKDGGKDGKKDPCAKFKKGGKDGKDGKDGGKDGKKDPCAKFKKGGKGGKDGKDGKDGGKDGKKDDPCAKFKKGGKGGKDGKDGGKDGKKDDPCAKFKKGGKGGKDGKDGGKDGKKDDPCAKFKKGGKDGKDGGKDGKKEDPCAKFKKGGKDGKDGKKDPCKKKYSTYATPQILDSCFHEQDSAPVKVLKPHFLVYSTLVRRHYAVSPSKWSKCSESNSCCATGSDTCPSGPRFSVYSCLVRRRYGGLPTKTQLANLSCDGPLVSLSGLRLYSKKKGNDDGKCSSLTQKYPKNRKKPEKPRTGLRDDCFGRDDCPKKLCSGNCGPVNFPRKKCDPDANNKKKEAKAATKEKKMPEICERLNKKSNSKKENGDERNNFLTRGLHAITLDLKRTFSTGNHYSKGACACPASWPRVVDHEAECDAIDDCDEKIEVIRIPCSYKIQKYHLPRPCPRDNDVLIRTGSVAITGSDIHVYENGNRDVEGMTLGHDATGFIEEVGQCVHHLHVGDRVVVESALSCGICDLCKRGLYNMCGGLVYNGFLATHQVHPADLCHRLPDSISMEEGTLTQTLALGCQACFKGNITPTSSVLIIGSCPTAVAAAMCSTAIGCKQVVIASTMNSTLEMVQKDFKFETVFFDSNALFGEVLEAIYRKFREWPNCVINCAISAMTMNLAVMALQPCGVCVLSECESECASFNALDILMKNIRLIPSFRSTNMYPTALQLIKSGRAPMHKLIARTYPMRMIEDAFRSAQHESNVGLRKIIVNSTEEINIGKMFRKRFQKNR